MKLSYPVMIKNYSGGQVGLFCVDVPEAVTAGNSLQEAIHNAEDALSLRVAVDIEPVPFSALVFAS